MGSEPRQAREVGHFTALYTKTGHTWWGNLSKAGQRRNDRRIRLLQDRIAISPTTRILEVGCGKGEYTRRLVRLGCSITAIDITPILIEAARREIPDSNVSFEIMDAANPRYPNRSFDLIFGKSILHHLEYRSALKAYMRLLKPGGRIFFSEPNLLNPLTFLALKIPILRKRMEFSDDETPFTRKHLYHVLVGMGYRDVVVEHFDFLHPSMPDSLVGLVEKLGRLLEGVPFLRAFAGSLLVIATAPSVCPGKHLDSE